MKDDLRFKINQKKKEQGKHELRHLKLFFFFDAIQQLEEKLQPPPLGGMRSRIV